MLMRYFFNMALNVFSLIKQREEKKIKVMDDSIREEEGGGGGAKI